MPVRGENVGVSIEVVIEEEETEREAQQAGFSNRRARRFINKKPIAFIMIKPDHLIRKVADHQVLTAGSIIVGNIDAHGSASDSIFPKRDSSREAFFLKCTVLQVAIKLIRL